MAEAGPPGGTVELRRTGHDDLLRDTIKELAQHEVYWNVMVFCSDGTLALNRLTVGLIFPQLQDEISVICPEHSMSDISTLIDATLDPLMWPASVCHVDWGLPQPQPRPQEAQIRDPLDQLCYDLAPFAQSSKPSPSHEDAEIQFIETSPVKPKEAELVDLTSISSPRRSSPHDLPLKNVAMVKIELTDPLADILAESSDDDDYNNDENMMDSLYHSDELHYTDNERMVQDILDSIIDNLEEYHKQFKQKAYQSAQVLFYSEASEYVEERTDQDCELEDDKLKLSLWNRSLDKTGKCNLGSKVDLQNLRLDFEAWNQINKILKDRESQEPRDQAREAVKNKKIYLKKKVHFGDEPNEVEEESHRCAECGTIFPGESALKRHTKVVHDRTAFSTSPTRIKLMENTRSSRMRILETVEITPMEGDGRGPGRPRKSNQNTAKKSTTKPPRRCGSCQNCLTEDCRKCVYCVDMKKYGGPGTKKQRCLERPSCLGLGGDVEKNPRCSDCGTSFNRDSDLKRHNAYHGHMGYVGVAASSTRVSSPVSRTASPVAKAPRVSSPNLSKTNGAKQGATSRRASPMSAARRHLRQVECGEEEGLVRKVSPLRIRRSRDEELKEPARRRGEGGWRSGMAPSKLTVKYKDKRERKTMVSARKVPPTTKNWPTKEELLFGFPLNT